MAGSDGPAGGGEPPSPGGGDVWVRGRYCVAGFAGFVGDDGPALLGSGFGAGAGGFTALVDGFLAEDTLEAVAGAVLTGCFSLFTVGLGAAPTRPPNFRCIMDPDGRAAGFAASGRFAATGGFAATGAGEALRLGRDGGRSSGSESSGSESEPESVMYAARS